jgi:N-acetylmuramoyl-L-alanine amidase
MKGSLTRLGVLGLAAVAAILPLRPVQAADVKSARVWAGPDYTRVVFDLSGPLHYRLSQQGGQVRLDLVASRVDHDFDVPPAQGLYKGLRQSRDGRDLQLLAQVGAHVRPKSFLLKPTGDAGYRLVLDLYPDAESHAAAPAAAHDDATADAAPVIDAKVIHSIGGSAKQAAALLNGDRKVIVAVDAGHGGEDPGAHGPGGTLEKNVTLAVARALAEQINKQPGMKAVLTRNGDYFIPLKRRYQIAREQNADMFVSIHADSFRSGDARGSSVWVLSPRGKTSEAARWLADRENRADLIGGVSLDDKNDSLAAVLLDLQQGYAMQASESIAGNVLKALSRLGPTHRGYVEHANFVVLRSPDVPSILVETAFISNPDEERKLRDSAHQQKLAEAVMGGVKNYFEATPPPGTWFAAQAARRNGVELASARSDSADEAAGSKAAHHAVQLASEPAPRADAEVRDLHRVGRGESLRSIARQYGVSVGALKQANRMNSDALQAGTVLTIPTS